MKNSIKRIIESSEILKNKGFSDYDIAKYVHIELGKLIVYNNDYTVNYEGMDIDKNIEGHKSRNSIKRQERLLNENIDINNSSQICKGMAEIYSAILNTLNIQSNVVVVHSKEEVEGEKREDGSIILPLAKYECSFNSDMSISTSANNTELDEEASHWYSVVNTDRGEFIQDYLTEKALTRIKVGESNYSDNIIPGFHLKNNHRDIVLNNRVNLNQSYRDRILSDYKSYCKDNNFSHRAFDFVFDKLNENASIFGFEEAKDFITLIGKILPRDEINQLPLNINLVKEDPNHCDVISVYQYNDKNYLVKGCNSNLDFPVGNISKKDINSLLDYEYKPRKLSDSKKIIDLQNKDIDNIEIESFVRNALIKCIGANKVIEADKALNFEKLNDKDNNKQNEQEK